MFLDEQFMLHSKTAVHLYEDYAKELPIFDYHCHLNPQEIWENKKFRNVFEVFLGGDHYKWRAMRSNGIPEEYITGDQPEYDKFMKWAETVPYLMGNPLYHWTHLELKRFFGITQPLSKETGDQIWHQCNEMLADDSFRPRALIARSNVDMVGTTDDPVSNLEYHQKIAQLQDFSTKVAPSFRPDKAVELQKPGFADYIKELGQAAGMEIGSFDDVVKALQARIAYFHENGCRISDHGLEGVPYGEASHDQLERTFQQAMAGEQVTPQEADCYKCAVIQACAREYARLGWTMQIHTGALRNNNTRMFEKLGPDTGFDSVHDLNIAYSLSRLLDSLEREGNLPKTILYTLNPKDNYVLGTMLGNFQGSEVPGKIQFGSGWWFNDQRDGMEMQMKTLANLGLLSRFVGMLTDSRSFLSYPRHEYFRRILCNLIGGWVEAGEYPEDEAMLKEIVQGICFYNAKRYFNM
ncbi:MAG: glucuronate isomerase [Clostridia bacterium]|nr:glucuronate isomerase [Clostridia bacterium]